MGKKAARTDLQVIGQHLMSREKRFHQVLSPQAKARGLTGRQILRQMSHCLRENKALMACTPESLAQVCEEACIYGVTIGGPLAEAYVVPYGREAKLIFGYRGLIRLLIDAGSAVEVGVEYVYEGDVFRRQLGLGKEWTHEAAVDPLRESRPVTHVYSEFRLPDGTIKRWCMTRDEIDTHARQYAQSYGKKDSPWTTAWKAMAAKTVLRQPIVRGLIPIKSDVREKFVEQEDQSTADFFDVQDVSTSHVVEPKKLPLKQTTKPPAFDPEALSADLAACQAEADVEDVRKAYLDGASAPEAETVKQYCMERVKQLMSQGEAGELFEKSGNAAET